MKNKAIAWSAVNPHRKISLPDPWNHLKQKGFEPTLHERVRRFALCEDEGGTLSKYEEFLTILGESFLPEAYDPSIFQDLGERFSPLQKMMLDAVEDLSLEFGSDSGNPVSAILWNTLSSLIVRPNPTVEDSILNVQEHLVHPWYMCDASLHAMGIAYGFHFHVQGRLSKKSGHVIFHGCGCNHFLGGALEVVLQYVMPKEKRPLAAKEFLDHFLGQTALIVEKGYPFRLNDESVGSTIIVGLKPLSFSN